MQLNRQTVGNLSLLRSENNGKVKNDMMMGMCVGMCVGGKACGIFQTDVSDASVPPDASAIARYYENETVVGA